MKTTHPSERRRAYLLSERDREVIISALRAYDDLAEEVDDTANTDPVRRDIATALTSLRA